MLSFIPLSSRVYQQALVKRKIKWAILKQVIKEMFELFWNDESGFK